MPDATNSLPAVLQSLYMDCVGKYKPNPKSLSKRLLPKPGDATSLGNSDASPLFLLEAAVNELNSVHDCNMQSHSFLIQPFYQDVLIIQLLSPFRESFSSW